MNCMPRGRQTRRGAGDITPEAFVQMEKMRRNASRQEVSPETLGLFNNYAGAPQPPSGK